MSGSIAMKKRIYAYSLWRMRMGVMVAISVLVFTVFKLQGVLMPSPELDLPSFPDQIPSSKPRVAFLFLARNKMPLDFLWEHFFKGSEEHEYTVYIHARPGVEYTRRTTDCKAFYNRQIRNSVAVEWGAATMIEAERLMLASALEDPQNERFILLSDSCVPLYSFKYIYDYVMTSPKSFVDSFTDYNDDRYNPHMVPTILQDKWRKGSQWFVLIRKHAEAIVADHTIFPVFCEHCKRLTLPEYWRDSHENDTEEHNCIPDEHYIQTLLAMQGLEEEIERRTLTYSRWKEIDKEERDRQGWHPITFNYAEASLQTIKEIQAINSINYVTESRREWCYANGEARPCFLFARKFTKGAGFRLLNNVDSYENPPVNDDKSGKAVNGAQVA